MVSAAPAVTYVCINMSFEEAYETMAKGEPLNVVGMLTNPDALATNMQGSVLFAGTASFDVPCLGVIFGNQNIRLYWTADGLSTSRPSSGK